MPSRKILRRVASYTEIIFGTVMTAAAFAMIIIPQNFAAGGVTGLAKLMVYLIPVPLSWMVFFMNLLLLCVGFFCVGKRFVLNTVSVSLLFPVMLDVLGRFPLLAELEQDPLVSALAAGVLLGVGTGLVIRGNGSSGGFDILAVVLNRRFRIPVDLTMNICGCAVIAAQALGHPLLNTVYGVVVILVCSFLAGRVVALGGGENQILIFSDEAEKLRRILLEDMDVGMTFLRGETGYRRSNMQVILCIAPYRKLGAIKQAVLDVDPAAFMVVDQVYRVMGQGYTVARDYQRQIVTSVTSVTDSQ